MLQATYLSRFCASSDPQELGRLGTLRFSSVVSRCARCTDSCQTPCQEGPFSIWKGPSLQFPDRDAMG